MKEAMFYEKQKDGNVQCRLCAWNCKIPEGKTGYCRVRRNSNGTLYSMVYGKCVSVAIDPIEKKPLFHFAPGSKSLSIATVGCNFRCQFCQNWEISQEYGEIFGEDLTPEKIVELAKDYNVPGIAYTYTEPTIFFEYAYDTMKLAKKEGLYNIWVSNGYTSPEVIKFMAKYLDAVNVDMKGNDEFYRKVCLTKGIQPVYDALKAYIKNGVWFEVTNLIIPGYNDSEKDLKEMAKWMIRNLGPDVPLHLSAFYPQYKLKNVQTTPVKTLEKAADIAKKAGIHWVYVGNIYSHKFESTYCWNCGELLIKRIGFNILSFKTKCPKCGEKVPIKGEKWKGV